MSLPIIVADHPLATDITTMLSGKVSINPMSSLSRGIHENVSGVFTMSHPTIDAELLDRLPNVKIISNYGVGVDHIDLNAAKTRNIPVGHTPTVLDGATADMAFALLLAAARNVVRGDHLARSPSNWADRTKLLGHEVHSSTLGIIGLGRIGRQVAQRGLGFDMRILYHNRRRDMAAEQKLYATYLPLEQILEQSDFLVITVPLSNATRGLIGSHELSLMKPSAILINIARGGVVDTDAITSALKNRQIAAAGLDVTEPEPLPENHPIFQLENVVLTPHLGSATIQTRRKMAEISVANLLATLEGKPLLYDATHP